MGKEEDSKSLETESMLQNSTSEKLNETTENGDDDDGLKSHESHGFTIGGELPCKDPGVEE